jgi:hypothetical protein
MAGIPLALFPRVNEQVLRAILAHALILRDVDLLNA